MTPTLHLLDDLRFSRMLLLDAIERGDAPEVIAGLEDHVVNAVEGLFDGGEVDRPVRCSYTREIWKPTAEYVAAVATQIRAHEWLAWGGDEWPRRWPEPFEWVERFPVAARPRMPGDFTIDEHGNLAPTSLAFTNLFSRSMSLSPAGARWDVGGVIRPVYRIIDSCGERPAPKPR